MKFLSVKYFLILLAAFNPYTEVLANDSKYCSLEVGEKVKSIQPVKNKDIIYIFIDLNTCFTCEINIKNIEKISKQNGYAVYTIIDMLDQEGADNIKNNNNFQMDVIGDETGIYNSYYKVNFTPTIVGVTSDGKVVGAGKLTKTVFDKIHEGFTRNQKTHYQNTSNFLKEIFRVTVLNNGQNIYSNGLHIDAISNSNYNKFYIRNSRKPVVYVVNDSGMVINTITPKKINTSKIWYANNSLSWIQQDSILSFLSTLPGFNERAYMFEIKNDSLISSIMIEKFSKEISLKNSGNTIYNPITMTYNKPIAIKNRFNQYIDSNRKILSIFNKFGKYNGSFNIADEIYKKYKLSRWFDVLISFDQKNKYFVTTQQFSNTVKIWNKDLDIINKYNYDLGDKYRKIKKDMIDSTGKEFYAEKTNMVTRTERLCANQNNNEVLILFYNEYYPNIKGLEKLEEVVIEKYFLILDDKGAWKYNSPYVTPDSFLPFSYDGKLIYGTEINDKNHLQIVCYEIE